MINIKDLTIIINKDGRKIIENLSFSVDGGDKLAIVGEEGNGKSTLAQVIAGITPSYADVSGIVDAHGAKCGYLSQFLSLEWQNEPICNYFLKDNASDECDYNKFASFGQVANLLTKLGLDAQLLDTEQQIGTLSGGEKVKLQLAKILLTAPDYLVLDEPTNDLDLPALEWLEGFINDCNMPIIFISHDEELLAKTANCILHIEQLKKKTCNQCNYSKLNYRDYVAQRSQALDKQAQISQFQHSREKAREERWREIYNKVNSDLNNISRKDPHGGRLLKKKMASVKAQQARFEREREELVQMPDVEESIYLNFGEARVANGKVVCDFCLESLSVGGKTLCKNIRLKLVGPQKIAIIGANGVGKTTLIKQIVEHLNMCSNLKVGYMPQNYEDVFAGYTSALQYAGEVAFSKEEQTEIVTFLGSLKFTRQEMLADISELSGGQKAKLYLARLMADKCQVLVLDEPTRNLSPLSNPVIRQALAEFGGAFISVSHDRKFIKEVSTYIYQLTPNGLVDITDKFKDK